MTLRFKTTKWEQSEQSFCVLSGYHRSLFRWKVITWSVLLQLQKERETLEEPNKLFVLTCSKASTQCPAHSRFSLDWMNVHSYLLLLSSRIWLLLTITVSVRFIMLLCIAVVIAVVLLNFKNIPQLIHLLKSYLSLLHWISFALLSKINWVYLCGSISKFSALDLPLPHFFKIHIFHKYLLSIC